jgi:glycerol-3-phosphate dehydrogenase (NAD(P)+)
MTAVAVVGAGSWGTALAHVLHRHGLEVRLWARDPARAAEIARTRRNSEYLPDLELDREVAVSASLDAVCRDAGVVIFAVPTHAMRSIASAAAEWLGEDAIAVSAAKGFEERTLLTMSAVISDVLPGRSVLAMSGPNIATEIACGLPAATVVAGESEAAEQVRDLCSGTTLRFYSSSDVIGVEFGGALKNVVAIAAGVCDGLGLGDNGKAAIITRGLTEMARLGVAAGGKALTFAGLTGLGDCVATCMSRHSRNRNLGEAIARGRSLDDVLSSSHMVVEGVRATRVALDLSRQHGVDMPIATEVHAILFEGKSIPEALSDLMRRGAGDELRGLGLSGL